MEIHRMCEKHVACETELGLGTTHTWRLEGGVPHTRHSTRKPTQTWRYGAEGRERAGEVMTWKGYLMRKDVVKQG